MMFLSEADVVVIPLKNHMCNVTIYSATTYYSFFEQKSIGLAFCKYNDGDAHFS